MEKIKTVDELEEALIKKMISGSYKNPEFVDSFKSIITQSMVEILPIEHLLTKKEKDKCHDTVKKIMDENFENIPILHVFYIIEYLRVNAHTNAFLATDIKTEDEANKIITDRINEVMEDDEDEKG